jgi:hypothetical protein
MINAKDARVLYEKSGQEVTDFLKQKVEKEVINAANSGKRQVFIDMGSVKQFAYLQDTITPLQQAVAEKLKGLGYRVEIKLDGESYVPRAWADDNGNGPTITNYGIHINW